MKESRHSLRIVCIVALLGALGAMSSCAGKADVVRPKKVSTSSALGEARQCTPDMVKEDQNRYVVEWNDGDRASLESEMSRGVALVKFTCEGMKVLRGCAIAGDYNYNGISRKKKAMKIQDAAKAQANLSSVTLPGSIKAAFEQGRELNLGYVMVGAQSTTVQGVSRPQIKSDKCKEATHFVFETQVGAFNLVTAERGQAVSDAALFGYGEASGAVSSGMEVASSDGNPQECNKASRKDEELVDGCAAILKVSILPIEEGKVAAVDAKTSPGRRKVQSCPEGFVFQDGECVEERGAEVFLCAEGDQEGCQEQCKKGSAESCGRLATIFITHEKNYLTTGSPSSFGGLDKIHNLVSPYTDEMEKACREDLEQDACVIAAVGRLFEHDLDAMKKSENGYPKSEAGLRAWAELSTIGCEYGSTPGCKAVVDIYGEGLFTDKKRYGAAAVPASPQKLDAIVGDACDWGNAAACQTLGEQYVFSFGVDADSAKSAKYFGQACLGGIGSACFWSTAIYGFRDVNACAKHLADNNSYLEEFSLVMPGKDDPKGQKKFCEASASVYDKKQLDTLTDKACNIDGGHLGDAACFMTLDLE